jgi:ClpP class serine protease
MSFKTASAILRGKWLIDKQWANAQLPVIFSLLNGESVDFGINADERADGSAERPQFSTNNYAAKNVYGVGPRTNVSSLPEDSVVMVTLAGPMIKYGDICSYGMIDQANLIKRLGDARNVSGIILNIDSPGGQVDGTAMLSDEISIAAGKKPVIAVIDDGMAASAAMWIASAASEIYVTQVTDQVGSIGVYTTIADWIKYYESQGLPVKEIYAPQSTDKNKNYYDALAGDEEGIKEDLAILADQFINTVAKNRAGKVKGDTWKTGKMFYAADAKKIGLIDGVKSLDQVVARISSLISNKQKQNSNTMAFEKTLATAGAESFAVTDEGFAMSEEQMTLVETALVAAEETAANLVTANSAIATLEGTVEGLQAAAVKDAETITSLQNQVAELGQKSSGTGTVITASEDEQPEDTGRKLPRYDSPDHPANLAAKRFGK